MSALRFGPYVLSLTNEGREFAGRAGIIVAVDNVDALAAAHPDAIRVHRHYFANQPLDADPWAVASEIIASLRGYRHPRLFVTIYFGVGAAETPQYVKLCQGVVPRLRAAGLRVCGVGAYSGSYTAESIDLFRKATVELPDGTYRWCGFERIGLQAYWTAQYGPSVFNAYRYRSVWQPGDPPVQILECGEDEVRDGPGGTMVGKPGWRANDGATPERFRSGLLRFAAGIGENPYVEGAAIFASGCGGSQWEPFETDGVDTIDLSGPANYRGVYDGRVVVIIGGSKVWLALVPSCQGSNMGIDGVSEASQMAAFAREFAQAASLYPALTTKVFSSPPETDNINFPNLRGQIASAVNWLNTSPVGMPTVTLHLHTDSGTSHVGAYHGNADITKRLAAALLETEARVLATTAKTLVNYEQMGYLAWTLSLNKHCPVLLELGSHESLVDISRLKSSGPKIADELSRTLLTFFKLPLTQTPSIPAVPTIDWNRVGEYARWATARLTVHEDPRDVTAFKAHLKALGADYANPRQYGLPV